MTDLTPDQLTATATIADGDLLMLYIVADTVMRKVRWDVFQDLVIDALADTYLERTNNLSDLPNPSAARGNLGLGSAALLAAAGVLQPGNNLAEITSAATARTNIGAAAANAPTITGGMTFSGSSKQNVNAVAAQDIDVSVSEFHTKSISSDTTFTFSGATASKAQGFLLELTISGASTNPTWPASVQWEDGVEADPGPGKHLFGFVTFDGGTSWTGFIGAQAVS